MRLLLRLAASAGIVAAAWLAARAVVVQPYVCNRVRETVARRTERLPTLSQFHSIEVARQNVDQIRPCVASPFARAAQDYLLLAENRRTLGRFEELPEIYRAALRHNERPEIHYALALALLDTFERDEARRHLLLASHSGQFVNDFPDPELRTEAVAYLSRRDAELRARAAAER